MIPLPTKRYSIILSDPPWRFKNWSMKELAERGEKWARRNGRSPYNVMDTEAICNLPIGDLAEKHCVLFLWATYPKLEDALKVMKAWRFTYKTVAFTWAKTNKKTQRVSHSHTGKGSGWKFGLGYWTRGNPELCLLGTRGKPKRINNCVPNLTISPVREHSQKPDEVQTKIVELMGDLPRIDLFARERTDGWDAWGEELKSP